MGNKAGVDMDIRQLGEAPTEELDSGTDSMSVSETSATSTDSTTNSGKDKKRFGSGRLLRWRGGTKKQAALKGELKIVILVCTRLSCLLCLRVVCTFTLEPRLCDVVDVVGRCGTLVVCTLFTVFGVYVLDLPQRAARLVRSSFM